MPLQSSLNFALSPGTRGVGQVWTCRFKGLCRGFQSPRLESALGRSAVPAAPSTTSLVACVPSQARIRAVSLYSGSPRPPHRKPPLRPWLHRTVGIPSEVLKLCCGPRKLFMDILEEMAAIEAECATGPGKAVREADMALTVVPSVLGSGKAVREVVPSPRGIQDFLLEFPTLPETVDDCGHPPHSLHPGHTHEQKKRPAVDTRQTSFLPLPPHPTDAHSPSNASASGYQFAFSPPPVVVPPSSYGEDLITPWSDDLALKEDPGIQTRVSLTTPREGLMNEIETAKKLVSSGHLSRSPTPGFHDAKCKVMPPTAKSILERRERAIREGRRHEAKLNGEERRILRRLRNRESAERCAKRKAEEADLLTRKIDDLERENARLRSVAAQFESAVLKLEEHLGGKPKPTDACRL